MGTQQLTITPDDTLIRPVSVTVGVFDPGELGDEFNSFDSAFVTWGNRRGFPPHVVKGLVKQEGSFRAMEYRYEPLSPTTGDRYVSKQITTPPYSDYRLATSSGLDKGTLLLDLNTGPQYTVADDVSPRQTFKVNRGPGGIAIPVRPIDVCPAACVSARELFEVNDDRENWSDPKYTSLDWSTEENRRKLEFTAQTPLAASYGLMQTMYIRAIELKWQADGGARNPSLLFDTPDHWKVGGGSVAVGTLELYKSYRACRNGDWATDPSFQSSAEYRSLIVDALNWYNHGNDPTKNPDYGANAWSFSQGFRPEHSASKVFP